MPKQYERELYEIAKAKPATIGKKTDAKDCSEFDGPNSLDGKYEMNGIRDVRGKVEKNWLYFGQRKFQALTVRCEFTKGKGWIIIQRRVDGKTNFTRGWNDYKSGFGTVESFFFLMSIKTFFQLSGGELWLGLEAIYRLTMKTPMLLEIIMQDTDGRTYTALYKK